jgi:hypothetical protein
MLLIKQDPSILAKTSYFHIKYVKQGLHNYSNTFYLHDYMSKNKLYFQNIQTSKFKTKRITIFQHKSHF